MRHVDADSEDWSIRFWAFDSDGSVVTGETFESAGMAISVVVREKGRIISTTALTLIARDVVGTHQDAALTEVGSGEYLVDLPDSYVGTADRSVSLAIASDAITGNVYIEQLEVSAASATGASGSGADSIIITISDDGSPIENASVWVSTDASGSNVVAGTLVTDANGQVTFLLTNGATYYLWAQKAGMQSIVGKQFIASIN